MHRAIAENRGEEGLARAHAEGDGLAETAAVFPGAARVVAQALLLDDQWREVLNDLDRRAEDTRRERRGRQAVLGGARAGAARGEEDVAEGVACQVLARHLDAPD